MPYERIYDKPGTYYLICGLENSPQNNSLACSKMMIQQLAAGGATQGQLFFQVSNHHFILCARPCLLHCMHAVVYVLLTNSPQHKLAWWDVLTR